MPNKRKQQTTKEGWEGSFEPAGGTGRWVSGGDYMEVVCATYGGKVLAFTPSSAARDPTGTWMAKQEAQGGSRKRWVGYFGEFLGVFKMFVKVPCHFFHIVFWVLLWFFQVIISGQILFGLYGVWVCELWMAFDPDLTLPNGKAPSLTSLTM